MTLVVVAVHPTKIICRIDQDQFDIPRAAFPKTPLVGQTWTITLTHDYTEEEQRTALNELIS